MSIFKRKSEPIKYLHDPLCPYPADDCLCGALQIARHERWLKNVQEQAAKNRELAEKLLDGEQL